MCLVDYRNYNLFYRFSHQQFINYFMRFEAERVLVFYISCYLVAIIYDINEVLYRSSELFAIGIIVAVDLNNLDDSYFGNGLQNSFKSRRFVIFKSYFEVKHFSGVIFQKNQLVNRFGNTRVLYCMR